MHLKQLKLAGFKSFVDPVVIPFSNQLVAVVGPNGCGKSNIIDAVRWVMGESSAKSLRGESMIDVIFNGSSNRKAVGQASVELVFDNQLGRLGGAYASYQEIALKRVVTRDGESNYYLNGTKCRRRDITEIFLGTGAGARGYSIISQGTISRLIEARPEELRAYLEEAAGVSKYKERRRETLQSIASTKENLARVHDVSDELGKQLVRLERQAESAKRYTLLKQDERRYKADIYALKWRALSEEKVTICQNTTELSLQVEHHHTQIAAAFKKATHTREAALSASDELEQVKAQFYQLGVDIARLEEISQQRIRDTKRLTAEKQALQLDWDKLTRQLEEDKEALKTGHVILEKARETAAQLQDKNQTALHLYQDQQQKEAAWNKAWQEIQVPLSEVSREIEIQRLRLQRFQATRQDMQVRFEKTQSLASMNQIDDLSQEVVHLEHLYETLCQQQHKDKENVQQALEHASVMRQAFVGIEKQLHQAEDELSTISTQHAAMSATMNRVMHRQTDATDVLSHWKDKPRLAELIDAPKEWQAIVEWVLGEGLYAIVLESMDGLLPLLSTVQSPSVMFAKPSTRPLSQGLYPRLVDKIEGTIPCDLHLLHDIFAASDLNEAMSWLPTLSETQSVVTMDGFWLGRGWVRVANAVSQNQESLIAQKNAERMLQEELVQKQVVMTMLQKERVHCHQKLMEHIEYQETCKQKAMAIEEEGRGQETLIVHKKMLLAKAQDEIRTLQTEAETLVFDLEKNAEEICEAQTQWQHALQKEKELALKQQQLVQHQSDHQALLSDAQSKMNEARQAFHDAQLELTRLTLKNEQTKSNISREKDRLDDVQNRLDVLLQALDELTQPGIDDSSDLDRMVQEHHSLEMRRLEAQKYLDALEAERIESEEKVQHHTKEVNQVQEKIQSLQLKEEALKVRIAGMVDALIELEQDPETVLVQLTQDTTLPMQEQNLLQVLEKIKRLGAINLVAIEEYESELLRKTHLDTQSQDLTDALTTLELAILKMDRETEQRFKETFDEVNALFQALFPRLFGGGRAMLELSCGNLLDAGVLVMAQPPGKRNSSIQLLSGGEKAMTAVALVFAIFKLNPSPFCMLDEVDAPLDDANVRRFCDLMKEMSQYVQFLFITHNKVTMELAEHLIGVTMREPGVSRVVAVDVEEALSIAQ